MTRSLRLALLAECVWTNAAELRALEADPTVPRELLAFVRAHLDAQRARLAALRAERRAA